MSGATRIHVAYVQGAYLRDYEKEYVPMLRQAIRCGVSNGIVLQEDPNRADIIILWEGSEYKTREYIQLLENDPLIRNHAERVLTFNCDDHPEGLLAGLYTSLEHPFFLANCHRIWPLLLMNNPLVYNLNREKVLSPFTAEWLFSFTGAVSHKVRKELFNLYAKPSSEYRVEQINKWYNHGDSERNKFLEVALASTFCLCPRGYCAYTNRITEVMAMGRVPVIIADDWIPFSFEESVPYYIKVAEKDIEYLPDILSERRSEAEELRRNARLIWEKYCSIENRISAALRCFASLAQQTRSKMSYGGYRARWHSREFLIQLGWTTPQQFALRAEQHTRRFFPTAKIPGVSPLMRYRNASSLK
jgi:hypothetical protein